MSSRSRMNSGPIVSLFEVVTFLGICAATPLNPVALAQTSGNQPTQTNLVLDLAVEMGGPGLGVTMQRSLNDEGIAIGQDGEEISRTFH